MKDGEKKRAVSLVRSPPSDLSLDQPNLTSEVHYILVSQLKPGGWMCTSSDRSMRRILSCMVHSIVVAYVDVDATRPENVDRP